MNDLKFNISEHLEKLTNDEIYKLHENWNFRKLQTLIHLLLAAELKADIIENIINESICLHPIAKMLIDSEIEFCEMHRL